jgi:hypothetical protein
LNVSGTKWPQVRNLTETNIYVKQKKWKATSLKLSRYLRLRISEIKYLTIGRVYAQQCETYDEFYKLNLKIG